MIWASFLIVIILLVILTFVWPPDSPWSPWWRTNKKVALAALKLAGVSKKDTVYELGSGDGEFILTAANEFGVKKAVGIEIEHTRFLVSMLKKKVRGVKNVELRRQDFKKTKLNEATVVYFYLVPAVIKRILPKLKKELSPGTKIVSLKYTVPLPIVKKDFKNKLYLYKI